MNLTNKIIHLGIKKEINIPIDKESVIIVNQIKINLKKNLKEPIQNTVLRKGLKVLLKN